MFLPFCPDPAAVPVNDALNNGQPHAGTLIFIFTVQPVKDTEKFSTVFHVEPGPVVPDTINIFRAFRGSANRN